MNLSVSPSRPCVGLGSDLITDVFAEDYTGKKAFGEVSRSFFFFRLFGLLDVRCSICWSMSLFLKNVLYCQWVSRFHII